ncbi:MAG: hypothetical protein ACWGNK_01985 [Desulfobacterales bacterium]
MTSPDIERVATAFGQITRRAQDVGFEAVTLHGLKATCVSANCRFIPSDAAGISPPIMIERDRT